MEEYYCTLQQICESLSHIVDAMPGKRFELDVETEQLLSSLRFSLPDSDLKTAVQRYLVIFSKKEETTVEDICNSFTAFVEIKVLVGNNTSNITSAIHKNLITEYNRRLKKQQNIIRVSRATKAYQELYKQAQMEEKEAIYIKIEETIEAEIKKYETLLENEPTEVVSDIPDIPDSPEDKSEKKQEVKEKKHKAGSGKTLLSGLSGLGNLAGDLAGNVSSVFSKRKVEKEAEDILKQEEAVKSQMVCGEIPYYNTSLSFSGTTVCKDVPYYSLCRQKGSIYLCVTDHIKGSKCDNSDNSIMELTKADDNFWQFVTVDLLSGEYKLKPFSKEEKDALRMYFNFICWIFEQNLGKTVNVHQYITFKKYYNDLVQTMFSLDDEFNRKYYKALMLCDNYIGYMDSYDLQSDSDKKTIISDIMEGKYQNYTDDLKVILEYHIVDDTAKEKLQDLISDFEHFVDDDTKDDMSANKVNEQLKKPDVAFDTYNDPAPQAYPLYGGQAFYPQMNYSPYGMMPGQPMPMQIAQGTDVIDVNDESTVTADDFSNLTIVVAFAGTNGHVDDVTTYTIDNLKQAVNLFLSRDAFIRKIGISVNGKDIYMYMAKGRSNIVPTLDDDTKSRRHINKGKVGQMVNFYEMQIKDMIKLFLQ